MSRIDHAVVTRAEAAAAAVPPSLSAELEQARRLTPEAVRALVASGVPKVFVPRSYGGAEASVQSAVAAIEALARADGALGWCGMIAATSGLMSGFLEDAVARALYAADDAVTAAVFAPMGRAEPVDGGHRVSGRWSFGSGCQHASWVMGGALVAGGPPRQFVFPAAAIHIHDTWETSGLRGTGSHDFEVRDLFVPAARTLSLTSDPPRHDGALYRAPFFGVLSATIAGVSLGIARRAIDALIELAGGKQPSGSRRTLAQRELVQHAVARAEAMVGASRVYLMAALDDSADEVERGAGTTLAVRARLRSAACHAASECARAVDLMYEAGGGTSIYATSPLGRCFRDVHVTTQHLMVSATSQVMAGRVMLGLDIDATFL